MAIFICVSLLSCYNNKKYKSDLKNMNLSPSKEMNINNKSNKNKRISKLSIKSIPNIKVDSSKLVLEKNTTKIDTSNNFENSNQDELVIDSSELINIINVTDSNIVIDSSEISLL